jgi:hypothetical protein
MLLTLAVVACAAPLAWADAGVFEGNGQNLRQVTSESVQLVSIDVKIILGRGPFLFDGTVPGMDEARYSCVFVLRNLTAKPVEVQVGFPVDSQFAPKREPIPPADATDWVLRYGFIARDERATYHVDFVYRPPKGPGEAGSLFVWKMHFEGKQTRTLTVQYRIPIAVALAGTEAEATLRELLGHPETHFAVSAGLDGAVLEMAGYVTATGSSWAGKVEKATFTVFTRAFERYLNQRGSVESAPEDSPAHQADAADWVQHPWWFRQITPTGWQKVEGGIEWRYQDFKPKEPIAISYYVTRFPRAPEDVPIFVRSLRKALGNAPDWQPKLQMVREILLATYGKQPESASARAFAERQIWYAPRKDFSLGDLTAAQQAVLKAFDAQIAEAK